MTDWPGDLIRQGVVERVDPDPQTARLWLLAAARHLEGAAQIAGVDPTGAYTLLYDGARKALAAAMLVEGLRVRSVPGAHRAVAQYAERLEAGAEELRHLRRFDAIRRNRNRSEYGTRIFGAAEVASDLDHATRIVEFVGRRISA